MAIQAFLVIDMLNDFVKKGAPLEVPMARAIVPNIKCRLDEARKQGSAVFFICDSHEGNDREFSRMNWPPHALKGTPGAGVIEELSPQPGEMIVEKTTYSAFYRTDLELLLRDRNISQLVVTGCVTNICILYSVADAVMRGFNVTLYADCVAGLSDDSHDFALNQMEEVLGVEVKR